MPPVRLLSPSRRLAALPLGSRFGLGSLALILVLGAALAHLLERQVARRAVNNAERTAAMITQVGLEPALERRDVAGEMSPRRLAQLDALLRTKRFARVGVERVTLLSAAPAVVYSDDRGLIGRPAAGSDNVQAALSGGMVSRLVPEVPHAGAGGETLAVFVPLRLPGGPAVDGVFEVHVSYDEMATAARADRRRMVALLGAGLLVLWLALYRIVRRAARILQRQVRENRHLALHDPLTGLANRLLLLQRAEAAVAEAQRAGTGAAVMLIDLDRFKEVNDTLGHDHGDVLLQEIAGRLRGLVREHDTLARLGGDEFGLLLPGIADDADVRRVATRIEQALREPVALGGSAVEIEASIGVAVCPDHGTDVHVLLRCADVAMYAAKAASARLAFYARERDPYSPERLALIGELRRAMDQRELVLHYQPKVDLRTSDLVGVEALLRWQHPERGLLPPVQFVPLAEQTGLIAPLTRYVIEAALGQAARWRADGLDIPVAVNLAGPNTVDPTLPDDVARLLAQHALPPAALQLEVSEGTVMADPQGAAEVLSRFRAMGVRLSLDDFGTGYSSLAYLKRLPLDELKIDRSFVMGMSADENDAAIVRSTIDLGRSLGLNVVAEGVESEEVLERLAALRCDVAQGYHLARPMPADAVASWLDAFRRRPPAALALAAAV